MRATNPQRTASASIALNLGDLGGNYKGDHGQARDVNNRGQIVGYSYRPTVPATSYAFLWEKGVMIDLGALPGDHTGGNISEAKAVNDRGQVVGHSLTSSFATHAFLWEDGVMTDLGTLGSTSSLAFDINNRGQVVGYSDISAGSGSDRHAFLWEDGVMTDLGTLGGPNSYATGINNRGQIAGRSDGPRGTHAFLWEDGVMTDLGALGIAGSHATALNDRGQVVGSSLVGECCSDYETHAFLWEDGVMTDLGTLPGGSYSSALGINNRGDIVGVAETATPCVYHAVVWTRAGQEARSTGQTFR